jgi:hypothetical protein
VGDEHVAAANELLGAAGIEDGSGIDFGGDFEGDTGREVGLDGAGDNVYRGALGGYDEVYAYGAGQLCEAGYGHLDFLTGGHDEIGELVDY